MVKTASELADVIRDFGEVLDGMGIRWERMLLFGSYANGTPHEGSDIDLVVIAPSWANYNLLQRLEILGIAGMKLLEPIQGYGVTQEEIDNGELTSFWDYIIHEQSIPILERPATEPVAVPILV